MYISLRSGNFSSNIFLTFRIVENERNPSLSKSIKVISGFISVDSIPNKSSLISSETLFNCFLKAGEK